MKRKTYSTFSSPFSKGHGDSADGSNNRSNAPQSSDPDPAQIEIYSIANSQRFQSATDLGKTASDRMAKSAILMPDPDQDQRVQSQPGSLYNANEAQPHQLKHLHTGSESMEEPHIFSSTNISLYQTSQANSKAQKEIMHREAGKFNFPPHNAVQLKQLHEASKSSLSPNHGTHYAIGNGNIVPNTTPASENKPTICTGQKATYQPNHTDSDLPKTLQDLLVRSSEHLNAEEKERLAKLLQSYQDVFARSSSDLGRCERIQHKINTGNAIPVRQPERRLPFGETLAEQAEIKKMLDTGVNEPSNSPWSSLVVLVIKKDGSIRFCVDYRVLNSLTVKDVYPFPRVDECLDALSGCKWFSSMDLNSGFWEVGLHPEDRDKSTFATSLGLFQFLFMPIGLANSPSTFEKLMEDVPKGLQWEEL